MFVCHCFLIAIAKLHKIRGMLRTKVDEIGCYCRKKMIFSIFSKNHFQKSRSGPENRFRIYRAHIQPKQKKRGAPTRILPSRAPKPILLTDWHRKSTKKRQRSPKQANTDLFWTKTTNTSIQHPKKPTIQQNNSKEKHFQFFRADNAYGIRTRRHTLPSIFQK